MSMNFVELLILLIPGFLGLWTFKRIVQENIDNRGESTQLALALMLGLSSLFCLFLVDTISRFFLGPVLPVEAILSPAVGKTHADMFFISPQFWIVYGCLCFLAVYNGYWWGILRERGWTLTTLLGRWTAEDLKRPSKEDCESSLRAVVNKLRMKENGPSLVRIYKLGENQGPPLIGVWNSYSETEKEIELIDLELCEAFPRLNEKIGEQARICWLNHESGIVVEFVSSGKEFNEGMADILKRKRENQVAEIVSRR
jgi:hypothetical protein